MGDFELDRPPSAPQATELQCEPVGRPWNVLEGLPLEGTQTTQRLRVVSILRTVPLATSITSLNVVVVFSPRMTPGR